MEYARYVISILFLLMGVGILSSARHERYIGLYFGAACYFGGGIMSLVLHSWWPLPIGFAATFMIRSIFGESRQELLRRASRLILEDKIKSMDAGPSDSSDGQEVEELPKPPAKFS